MKPIDAIREKVECVHAWANEVHARYTIEYPLNPYRGPHKAERQQIADSCLGVMKSCTQILDALDAIEEAKDEMDAGDRDSFKRDFQGGE